MSMAHLLFERDFEAEIDAERLLAERQAVVHTADELMTAAAAGRAEGHAAGLAEGLAAGWREALAAIEAQRLDAIGKLAVAVDSLLAERAAHRHRLEAEMAAFAGDLADRVFPELVRDLGARRVDEEIARVVGRAIGSPSLEIRLWPAVAEALGPEVHADWLHGRSRYSFAAICRSIQSLIRRAAPVPATDDHAGQTHE
jgi:flagellar biosynthesis/type III secretory pathway protein FliH